VLVAGFPSGAFQANCFVLAADAGEPCVVVDPGQDAEDPLEQVLLELLFLRRRQPTAGTERPTGSFVGQAVAAVARIGGPPAGHGLLPYPEDGGNGRLRKAGFVSGQRPQPERFQDLAGHRPRMGKLNGHSRPPVP